MNPFRLALALITLLAPLPAFGQVDAPTGTYKGTLVHERRLILKQTDPERVTSFKEKTKVTGFGYVPNGGTPTFIRLIAPPGAHSDLGLDRQLTIDFNQDPPVFEVSNGEVILPIGFPTVTVDGKFVTVESSVSVNTPDYEIQELNTLSLKRTKP